MAKSIVPLSHWEWYLQNNNLNLYFYLYLYLYLFLYLYQYLYLYLCICIFCCSRLFWLLGHGLPCGCSWGSVTRTKFHSSRLISSPAFSPFPFYFGFISLFIIIMLSWRWQRWWWYFMVFSSSFCCYSVDKTCNSKFKKPYKKILDSKFKKSYPFAKSPPFVLVNIVTKFD